MRRWLRLLLWVAPWIYVGWVRRWHLRWGATDDEVREDLPGDDLVPHPMLEATRAVSIAAPPEQVWPWIVQMGYARAGFYAIDLVDNGGRPSADRIHPEWQHLGVGDVMPTAPDGTGFTVAALDPPRSIVLHVPELVMGPVSGRVVVSMSLRPQGGDGTRLVCRLRGDFGPGLASGAYALLFDPGDFVMMRAMLRGIRSRAEPAAAAQRALEEAVAEAAAEAA